MYVHIKIALRLTQNEKYFIFDLPMKKKYVLKDIAKLAGVSIGTVDRVIHNRGRVSAESEKRVKAAIKELHYVPNPVAQSLKNNKVHQIRILLPDPSIDPYWVPCEHGIHEIKDEFKAFDLDIELSYFDPVKVNSFKEAGEAILDQKPDSLLFVPLFEKESVLLMEKLKNSNTLTSTFNSPSNSGVHQFIGQNLFLSGRVAAKLACDHLPSEANVGILHLDESFNNALHMQEKEKGFRAYFEENCPTSKLYTHTWDSSRSKYHLEKLQNDSLVYDILFVTNSKIHPVAMAVHELGLKTKLIGYDLLKENVVCLKEGRIDFLIHQAPKTQASLSLKNVIEHLLFKKPLPETVLLPIEIINSENVDSYL